MKLAELYEYLSTDAEGHQKTAEITLHPAIRRGKVVGVNLQIPASLTLQTVSGATIQIPLDDVQSIEEIV